MPRGYSILEARMSRLWLVHFTGVPTNRAICRGPHLQFCVITRLLVGMQPSVPGTHGSCNSRSCAEQTSLQSTALGFNG